MSWEGTPPYLVQIRQEFSFRDKTDQSIRKEWTFIYEYLGKSTRSIMNEFLAPEGTASVRFALTVVVTDKTGAMGGDSKAASDPP